MDTIKINSGNTKIIAHRGLSGIECENTNAAFVAAGNRSYYGIETDTHVTKDVRFAILHDDDLKRVAGANIRIEECNLSHVDAIRLYDKEEGVTRRDLVVPELRDYIRICKRYGKIAVLELKTYAEKEVFAKMIDEIRELDYLDNMVFISFGKSAVLNIRELLPEAKVQFLTCDWTEDLIPFLKENKLDLDIHHPRLTRERIALLHENGIEVNCFTVDDKDRAEELASYGIDYITTNILE